MSRNTRADVVEAAGEMFATFGYEATSMRRLGKELGLVGSSLYSHVGSKQDLLVEVVVRGADLFEASVENAPTDGTGLERLRALIAGHINVVLDHRAQVKTFLNEARSLDDTHRDAIRRVRNRYEEAFRSAIRQGVSDGSMDPHTNPALASIFILSILNAIDRWYSTSGRLSRTGLVDEVIAFANV